MTGELLFDEILANCISIEDVECQTFGDIERIKCPSKILVKFSDGRLGEYIFAGFVGLNDLTNLI